MILVRENIERETDDPKRIEELKKQGYRVMGVIANDKHTKGKSARKASSRSAK